MKRISVLIAAAALMLMLAACTREKVTIIRETDNPEIMDIYNDDGTPHLLGRYTELPDGTYTLQSYTVFEYDGKGNEVCATEYSPRGNVNYIFDKTYDGEGRLVSEKTTDSDGDLVRRLDYSYDDEGNVTNVSRTEGAGA